MAVTSSRSTLSGDAPQLVRGRALYWLWAVFWLLMVVIAIQEETRNPSIRWWEPILWETSSAAVATVWLLIQRRAKAFHARYLDQPARWFAYQLLWLPVMAVTFIGSIYAIRHGVYALAGREYRHDPWAFVFVYESIKIVLFTGLWLGIVFGFESYAQWQTQRERLAELQRTLAEAELARLKAQLRPHFFFNALNTISALMHVDVARADRLLARLGELLRLSLQSSDQELTTLREELHALELYAQVMQERFAGRVSLAWRIDEAALGASVPALLLQPLLENAFKHGVERSVGPATMEVIARREQDALHLIVRNTGSTLASDTRGGSQRLGPGVGLRNCRERLRVMYGDAASLQLQAEGDVVAAIVTLPWRELAA